MNIIQNVGFITAFIIMYNIGTFLFLIPGFINCNCIMKCNELNNYEYKQILNYLFFGIGFYISLLALGITTIHILEVKSILVHVRVFITVFIIGVFLFLTRGYINCHYIMEYNVYKQFIIYSYFSFYFYIELLFIGVVLFYIVMISQIITLKILKLLFPKYYNFEKSQKKKINEIEKI